MLFGGGVKGYSLQHSDYLQESLKYYGILIITYNLLFASKLDKVS